VFGAVMSGDTWGRVGAPDLGKQELMTARRASRRRGWGSQASLEADGKEMKATARNMSVRVPWNFSS
jgi:hypothetical protein